jgi:hypothetical protein
VLVNGHMPFMVLNEIRTLLKDDRGVGSPPNERDPILVQPKVGSLLRSVLRRSDGEKGLTPPRQRPELSSFATVMLVLRGLTPSFAEFRLQKSCSQP